MSKPGGDPSSGINSGDAWDGPSGIRHVGGANLDQAFVLNVRTCSPMLRDKPQAAPTARARVPKRSAGAEQPVVVMQCRTRHCITHADWRIMPNGFAKTPCSRGFVAGRAIVVLLAFGIV